MTDSVWEHPDYLAWAKEVREGMFPKMAESSVNMALITDAEADVKLAVEIGYGILLDKPLVVLVTPGVVLSKKLVAVADEIITVDLDDMEASYPRVQAALTRIDPELGR